MGLFKDRVVLVSGAGGGQGRIACMAFAREGAHVLGCDIVAEASAETTRLVCEAGFDMHSVEPLDLAEPEDASRWADEAISRWGRIDVLYNNAAGVAFAPFDVATIEDWNFTIRNELTLSYVATRAVWPQMVKQRSGVVISVASIAGHLDLAEMPCPAHGAANAGLMAMSRMFAAKGAPYGIRSVTLSPGIVSNPNTPPPFNDPNSEPMRRMWGPAAMARPAQMHEIIEAALFLASDRASYITGIDLAVDGGMSGIILPRQ